jgi:hypothetical protein
MTNAECFFLCLLVLIFARPISQAIGWTVAAVAFYVLKFTFGRDDDGV